MPKKLKKGKIVRREGINLFDSEKFNRLLARRPYGPGVHGPKGTRRRKSIFGEQLRAKQQLKLMYGMRERQFANLVAKSTKSTANTAEEIIKQLERRLDNVVYRLNLAQTRSQARQMVSHRHIAVNGAIVNIPSYQVKKGDVVQVKLASQAKKLNLGKVGKDGEVDATEAKQDSLPLWLGWDSAKKEGKITGEPDPKAISSLINISRVVEFYSR